MITREELRQIPNLYRQIERDKEQLRFLREKATCVPSTLTDHERVQTSPSSNVNKYIEEAVDLDKEIQEKELELIDLQGKAKEFIGSVEDPLAKRILRLRYLRCHSWEEVAELTGYVVRWVQQVERNIIQDL